MEGMLWPESRQEMIVTGIGVVVGKGASGHILEVEPIANPGGPSVTCRNKRRIEDDLQAFGLRKGMNRTAIN